MKTGIASWVMVSAVAILVPLNGFAWEPNAKDLDAAIAAGDFADYQTKLTAWVAQKVPAESNRITEAAMKGVLKDPVFAGALAQRQFIAKHGLENLAKFAKAGKDNCAFLTWIMKDTAIMVLWLEGASPLRIGTREENSWGISTGALEIWKKICIADPDSKDGLYLRLAMATALRPPGSGNRGAGMQKEPSDPLVRYTYFKNTHKKGELFRSFDTRTVWELQHVVSSCGSEEDMTWAREAMNTWRPDWRIDEKVVDSTTQMWRRNSPWPYTDYKTVFSGGGKCGPRSSWSVFVCQAFGIPAIGVGQPAHACAAVDSYKDGWQVVQGRGWNVSKLEGMGGNEFVECATAKAHPLFSQIEQLRWLASTVTSKDQSGAVLALAKAMEQSKPVAVAATVEMSPASAWIDLIPFDSAPDGTCDLQSFEAATNMGTRFESRVRGFVYPPASGSYVFSIAGDDDSDLFLSSDATPANKKRIAFVKGWTGAKDFKKSPTQKSVPVSLQAGKQYYIEAIHKQEDAGDHVSVAWSGPGVTEGVIPGSNLSPYPSGAKGKITSEVWKHRGRQGTPPTVGPGSIHIEAASFAKMGGQTSYGNLQEEGVVVVDCFTGGQQVLFQAHMKSAWVDYAINVPETATYSVEMRLAAMNEEQVLDINSGTNKLASVAVPLSYGIWETSKPVDVALSKGPQTLRVSHGFQRGVAMRWMELKKK
ncbi:MAG: PA14 domain-containing protein [bacterium]